MIAAAQREQGLMNVEPPFESDPQLSESSKPRVDALDNPAVFAKGVSQALATGTAEYPRFARGAPSTMDIWRPLVPTPWNRITLTLA